MANQQLIRQAAGLDANAESARLEAVDRYELLDTSPEPQFDRIVRLIRNIFDLPIGIVSLIDGHRQWYKAYEGMAASEVAINDTFCRFGLHDPNGLFVGDATTDSRFAGSPYVTGAPHIRCYASAPMRTRDGHPVGTLCAIGDRPRQFDERDRRILFDLAQITMDEMELRLKASTDSLTGAMTRRAFSEAGLRQHMLAMRHGDALSAIAIDIDHFKGINDRFGHAAGDAALQAVAQTVQTHLRQSDLFGRFGGEEFVALLPHTDKAGAIELAERLRAGVEALTLTAAAGPVPVTASFGVSQLSLSTLDLAALLGQADAALYRAKAAGRNRVMPWNPEQLTQADVRRRTLKAGRISYRDGDFTVECTVRSLSDRSAGMDVMNSADLPVRFKLSIPSERIERECRVTVRSAGHVEVEFI